ncbi:MAG: acyltransferase family protein [Casimicrobium sp.]
MTESAAPLTPSPERRYDLDWLRIIAFGLLILYHVGMYYVTWDFHIKSPNASDTIEPLMMLTSPWRLTLLFVVSGAATHFILMRRTTGQFVRERSRRLLWPLAFAMLVVVPPQSYYEVMQWGGRSLDYADFWWRYLHGDHSFCKDGKCLGLPTWNHMWFVAYLWVYAMLLALMLRLAPASRDRITDAGERWLRGWRLIALPVAYITLTRWTLLNFFPSTHNLTWDWLNHATYLPAFLFGVLFLHSRSISEDIRALRWPTLGLALLSYALLIAYFTYYDAIVPPLWLKYFQRAVWGLNQWTAIIAAFGFAQVLLNRDGPARRYLTGAVFPLYLFHQTLIIVFAWHLLPFKLAPLPEGLLLVAMTTVFGFLLYEIGRRVPYLRTLIGARADGK